MYLFVCVCVLNSIKNEGGIKPTDQTSQFLYDVDSSCSHYLFYYCHNLLRQPQPHCPTDLCLLVCLFVGGNTDSACLEPEHCLEK